MSQVKAGHNPASEASHPKMSQKTERIDGFTRSHSVSGFGINIREMVKEQYDFRELLYRSEPRRDLMLRYKQTVGLGLAGRSLHTHREHGKSLGKCARPPSHTSASACIPGVHNNVGLYCWQRVCSRNSSNSVGKRRRLTSSSAASTSSSR